MAECQFCQDCCSEPALTVDSLHTVKSVHVFTGTSKTAAIRDFLKRTISLLNDEGGPLIIPFDSSKNLDFFDEKIDGKLSTLIPENDVFMDVYPRSLNANHLCYHVKPRSGQRLLSTLIEKWKTPALFQDYMGTDVLEECLLARFQYFPTQGGTLVCLQKMPKKSWHDNFYQHQYSPPSSKLDSGGSIFIRVEEEETNVMLARRRIVQGLHTNRITQHEIQELRIERSRKKVIIIDGRVPNKPWNLSSLHFSEAPAVPLEVQSAVLKILDHQSQGSKKCKETSSRPLRENTRTMNRGLASFIKLPWGKTEEMQRHSKPRKREIENIGANATDTTLPFSPQFKGRKDGTLLEKGNIPTTVDEKHPIVGVMKKLVTFKREDYTQDTTLIGADPLRPDYPLVHKGWTTGETHGRQFSPQFQDKGHISKTLREYAKDSELWVWISETLPEYFDLPVTTKPPKDVVQAFLTGVNLPIILLTVCQEVEKAREYANETASALKWRVLDFCHLDFLLLPCVVPTNFDLNDLEDEIKKQQQKLSWCHGGPTRLDENTFPTMKAATNALAGSTWVPCLLEDNGTEEMETLVMEEEWRDLMLRRIDELTRPGDHGHTLQLNLDPDVPFKEKVAEVEAMKRMSVRNWVTVVIPTPDSKLDACVRRLKQEVFERYGVNLQIKVTTEVQEGSPQETTRAGGQTSDEAASDQTSIPSVPMSLTQGTKSLVLTNRG